MISSINVGIISSKPLPQDVDLQVTISPLFLKEHGFVIPVTVQTPSILCAPPFSKPLRTITAMALLDTGASRTCISDIIATDLELDQVGFTQTTTAGGPIISPDYAVDILLPKSNMKGFQDFVVGSCALPYRKNPINRDVMAQSNFGVLIGRDMMAKWSIVWHGPTSSVFISD
jgi:hypothetical protein